MIGRTLALIAVSTARSYSRACGQMSLDSSSRRRDALAFDQLASAAFVRRVAIAVHEGDDRDLHARRRQFSRRLQQAGVIQRIDLRRRPRRCGRATSRTSSRGTSGAGRRESNRIGCGMRQPLQFEQVAEACCGDHADAGAAPLDQRVGRDRAAVGVERIAPRHRSGRSMARISSTPVRMLSPGRDGVLGTLKQCTSPDGVTNTRSVNVPPTSVPIEQ